MCVVTNVHVCEREHRCNESISSPKKATAIGSATATHDFGLLLISARSGACLAVHIVIGELLTRKDVSQREEGDARQPKIV